MFLLLLGSLGPCKGQMALAQSLDDTPQHEASRQTPAIEVMLVGLTNALAFAASRPTLALRASEGGQFWG